MAYELDEHLRHIRTIRLWRGQFGSKPPFDTQQKPVVGYSVWAEMTNFERIGWEFPKYVFDLHTAYLSQTNFLLQPLPLANSASEFQRSYRTLAECTGFAVGRISTSRKWPRISPTGFGRSTDNPQLLDTARRTLGTLPNVSVACCADFPEIMAGSRRSMCRMFCIGPNIPAR